MQEITAKPTYVWHVLKVLAALTPKDTYFVIRSLHFAEGPSRCEAAHFVPQAPISCRRHPSRAKRPFRTKCPFRAAGTHFAAKQPFSLDENSPSHERGKTWIIHDTNLCKESSMLPGGKNMNQLMKQAQKMQQEMMKSQQ
ncbi:MAG: hypothetical protein PHY98_06835, partial [Candidatus Cloacimonetes bacterium]|nr:hypothetical protein [Candidatus Cloacimonadota bacterium]